MVIARCNLSLFFVVESSGDKVIGIQPRRRKTLCIKLDCGQNHRMVSPIGYGGAQIDAAVR